MNSPNRVARTLTTLSVLSFVALPARAALVDATWNGGVGNWNNAALWSPNVIPNNGVGGNTYHVRIDNGNATVSPVTLNINANIDQLTITSGDTLSFAEGFFLNVVQGPIVNDGTLSLDSNGILTRLLIPASMSLSGSGTLLMSDNAQNLFADNGVGNNPLLTHGAAHTIRGAGQIGANGMRLTNDGLIQADQPTKLLIDLSGIGVNTNTGTLQATGTSTLDIFSTVLTNTDGVIRALGTSTVDIRNSTINGGGLHADPGSAISPTTAAFQGISLTGLLRHDNQEAAIYEGTITNNGTIALNSTGNSTSINIQSTGATFNGTGQIVMSDNANNIINDTGIGANPLLVSGASHTIRGAGQIGGNSVRLTNDGLIQADQPTKLSIDLAAPGANTNTGIMQATGTSLLEITSSVINNTDGVVQAQSTSTVDIINSTINGGVVHADPGSAISPTNGIFQDITLTGLMRHDNNDDAEYGGVITNNGTIALNSTGLATEVRISNSGATFNGTGQILMSNNFQNYVRDIGVGANPLLVNGPAHTIRGAGQLGANTVTITNQGTITADQPVPLVIANLNLNSGTINATGAGGILTPGSLITSGTVNVATGSSITLDGLYHQTAGNTTINGTMETGSYIADGTTTVNGFLHAEGPSGFITILGQGVLKGNGTVTVSLLTGGIGIGPFATLAVGDPIGSLAINGALDQQGLNSSVLEFEIGGLIPGIEHDVLDVSGPVYADGVLRIRFVNGFDPQIGDSFTIMGNLLHDGPDQYGFNSIDVSCNLPGRAVKLASTVFDNQVIEIIAAGDLIDVNCDCAQSLEIELTAFIKALIDPAAFATQYPGCPIASADRNNDGLVNGRDVQPFVTELLN